MAHRVAVYLILERGGRVLLGLRSGTGYRDGEYGLPSGKVDDGETLTAAAVREAREEIAIDVGAEDLQLVHVCERLTPTGLWLDFYYRCLTWRGEPANDEPHKCAQLEWLEPGNDSVVDYINDVLAHVAAGETFSSYVGP